MELFEEDHVAVHGGRRTASDDFVCSCGWSGSPDRVREHFEEVKGQACARVSSFAELIRERVTGGDWPSLTLFEDDRRFLTPSQLVSAIRNQTPRET
ncbi:MAG TPA: hypothetical protein VGF86_08205 [Candidatus Tumulicola sp.]|jgi:hypothetical protein